MSFRPLPGRDLGAAPAALEFRIDVAAQQPDVRAGPLAAGPQGFWPGYVIVNQVELAGGRTVEAIHRTLRC